jgi:hypothetical protein
MDLGNVCGSEPPSRAEIGAKSGPAIYCGLLQGIASKRFVSTYSYDFTGKDAGIEGQSIEPRIAGARPIPFHDPRFQNPYFPQFRRG